MKVVIDTNVFVSGIHWSGDSEKMLRAWSLKKFQLVSSIVVIRELTRILSSFKIPLSPEYIQWWEDVILEKAVIVIPTKKCEVVKDDPDDDKFIEAALQGNASYIVTQDKHLLKLKEYCGIRIVTPAEFLSII